MKILITGASGLIGSHLIRELKNQHDIFALSRRASPIFLNNKIHWIHQDLIDNIDFACLPNQIDLVIHLAQFEHFRNFPENAVDLFQVNTVNTLRLLDYSLKFGAKSFIYASSGGLYGYSDHGFTEDAELKTRNDLGLYFGSKLCSEILSDCYTSFLNVIILRFFFVYGPGQKKSMLIPRLVDSVIQDHPIVLQGADGIRINPTYVLDAVSSIIQSFSFKTSHKINVAGPEILTLRGIGETIGAILKKEPTFLIQNNVNPKHLIADIKKMKKLLLEPRYLFKEGIERYIESLDCLD